MTNNYDNDHSWITLSELSPENEEIFNSLNGCDKRFGVTYGGLGFRIPIVPGPGNDTFEAFKELIELFPMQDVQKDGCMTTEEFMMYYTDCYRMEHTPEYKEMVSHMMSPDGDVLIYDREFEGFKESIIENNQQLLNAAITTCDKIAENNTNYFMCYIGSNSIVSNFKTKKCV